MTSEQPDSERSLNIPHIGGLDDLRGIAALMVFVAHVTHNLTRGVDTSLGTWLKPENPFFAVLAEGHAGVSLFMVLSGFLFSYGAYGKEVSYAAFIKNRILRIYPMYLMMLLLGAYTNPSEFSFVNLLASIFLFSNTTSGLNGGGFTILLWTISAEFMFYLIFPFLHRFASEKGLGYLYKALGLAIMLRFLCIGLGANPRDISYFTLVGRIDQFLIGMITANYYCRGSFSISRPKLALIASSSVVILSLYALNRLGGWERAATWKALWHTYEGLIFGALIIAYLGCAQSMNRLYRRAMGRIGVISFSIYLIHMPILLAVQRKHLYLSITGDLYWDAMITMTYLLPLVLFVSTCTFELIERPFMSFRGKYLHQTGPAKVSRVAL